MNVTLPLVGRVGERSEPGVGVDHVCDCSDGGPMAEGKEARRAD